MDSPFPRPPQVPQNLVDSLASYADRCAAHLEDEHQQARLRGHTISGQSLVNLEGYRFTALFLRETYDMPTQPPR